MESKPQRIGIIGDGGWGTTLSVLLAGSGYKVTLWGAFPSYADEIRKKRENAKFLPGVQIPETVEVTSDAGKLDNGHDLFILAVPSQHVRSVLQKFRHLRDMDRIIVSATKGIENKTLLRMSELIGESLGSVKIAALSGPTIAFEVARGIPAAAVMASSEPAAAEFARRIIMSERFRIYTCSDLIGVELGGSLKNVIAIACGIADGLGFGSNSKAALLVRGLVEMKRLGVKMGAMYQTFDGLSGNGDLFTTCVSSYGRNRYAGQEIAKGRTVREITESMDMVVEGIPTTESAMQLGKKYGVEMPITEQVYSVLFEGKNPFDAVKELMSRAAKSEEEFT